MTTKNKYSTWLSWRIRQSLGFFSPLLPNHPKPIKRILCILSGGLGDRLMVLPALRFLRRQYPDAHMCVAWFDGGLPVVDAEFDEVLTFPPGSTRQKIRAAGRGYDLCFVSSLGIHNVLTEICALVSGATIRMGPVFSHTNPRKSVYNHPYVFGAKHETVINCAGAGWSGTEEVLSYPIHLDRALSPSSQRTRLGLHVGCKQGYEMKRWSPNRYHSLIQTLSQTGVFEFVLIGDRSEEALMEQIAKDCPQAFVKVLGILKDFIDQVQQCDVFIGNDSGLCHLAAALDVPTVTIMGPTNPDLCRPVFSQGKLLQATCVENFCFYSGASCQRCIDTISADQAAETIQSLCPRQKKTWTFQQLCRLPRSYFIRKHYDP